MRRLKIVGWVAGCLVMLIAAAGMALWLGGGPVVAWAIKYPGSAIVGRQIRIAGPLTVHWGRWGTPTRIIAEDVHVANAGWTSDGDMFVAKRLEIDIVARTLLHGPLRIPLIRLDGAKLLLEKSPAGEGNWKFGTGTPKKRHEFPDLERFVVHQSNVVWHNGRTGANTEIGIENFDYAAPAPTKPVTLAASGTFAGSFQKLPIHISGTAGPLTELRNPSTLYPVKFNGAIGQVDLAVEGTIKEPLDFAGVHLRLSLSGRKLDELAAALGVPLPELPDFRGTSELSGGNGNWLIKSLTIALGKSDLEGGVAIDTNAKVPHVVANLTSSKIDLADFKGLYGGKPAHSSAAANETPEPGHRIIPDNHIAVHKLPGTNIDLSFDGTRILSSTGLPFERVSLGLQVKNGEIAVKPLRFHTARGDVDLNLHFTPFTQDSPPRLGADINVGHVDLHELLRNSTSPIIRETGGILGGFIKIDTTGTSLREFLARMDGDGGIFMENGQLSELLQQLAPINVLGVLGVYATGDRPLPINCLVSRFDIKQGVATASTFLFDTTDTLVTGAGNINFGDETLYLKLTPYNKGPAVVSLHTPVDVTGTFAQRNYHVHTGGIVARLGAAVGLGILFPPAALLPLIDTGLGEHNACSTAYAAQQPPGDPTPKMGSSTVK